MMAHGSPHAWDPEVVEKATRVMLAIARDHLSAAVKRRVPEEEIVQTAFRTFFKHDGQLNEDGSIPPILRAIVKNKAISAARREICERRDVRLEVPDAADVLDQIASRERLKPEDEVMLNDLLDSMPTEHRDIAILRWHGYDDVEIADIVGCSRRTVQRKRETICRKLSMNL